MPRVTNTPNTPNQAAQTIPMLMSLLSDLDLSGTIEQTTYV
jgi:hypothetical protein